MRAAILAAAFVAACNLPDRDNRHDPTRAPVVSLEVTPVAGAEAGTFRFDASASFDPYERYPLTFTLEVDGVRGDMPGGVAVRRLVTSSADMPCPPCDGTGAVPKTAKVTVSTRTGHYAVETVTLAVSNREPAVDLGDDLFVSPTLRPDVTLDPCAGVSATCSSADPDGNGLVWSWRTIAGDVALAVDSAGRATFTPPEASAVSRPLVFEATASDGLASSSDRIAVYFEPQLWIATVGPTRLIRVLPSAFARASYQTTAGAIAFKPPFPLALGLDDSTGEVWVSDALPTFEQVVHRLRADLRHVETWSTGAGGGVVVSIAPVGSGACLAKYNAGFMRLAAGAAPVFVADSAAFRVMRESVGTGCWAVSRDRVRKLSSNGTLTSVAAPALGNVLSAARAADGALWVSDVVDSPASTSLHRIEPDGSAFTSFPPLDGMKLHHLASDGEGGMFAGDAVSFSIVRVRPDGTLDPDVRVTNAHPAPPAFLTIGPQMVFDELSKTLWLSEFNAGAVDKLLFVDGRLEREGRKRLEELRPNGSTAGHLSIDRTTGDAVFIVLPPLLAEDDLRWVARLPAHLRHVDEMGVDSTWPASPSVDADRGAVWIGDGEPEDRNGLFRVAPDGRVLHADRTLPIGTRVSARADGSAFVAFQTTSGSFVALVSPDGNRGTTLASFPGAAVHALDHASADSLCVMTRTNLLRITLSSGQVEELATAFEARAIAATGTGGCWFLANEDPVDCAGRLYHFPPGSDLASVDVDSIGSQPLGCMPDLAIDPRDGSVWISDQGAEFLPPRLLHVSASGALLGEWPTPPGGIIETRMTCSAPSSPHCLEIWHERDGVLHRLDGANVEIETRTLTGFPTGSALIE